MTSAALFLAIFGTQFHPDAYIICGPKPQNSCLVWVDQCLTDALKEGTEADEAFEWCAEGVDPNLVNWGEFPNPLI